MNFYPTGRHAPSACQAARHLAGADLEQAHRGVERELLAGLRRQNEWLCGHSNANPRIVAGLGIQELLSPEEMVEEVELRATQGARTVKLIPGWFHEMPNDRRFWPMYERCQELGLAVTADTGSPGWRARCPPE